jgi:hypothetical protein
MSKIKVRCSTTCFSWACFVLWEKNCMSHRSCVWSWYIQMCCGANLKGSMTHEHLHLLPSPHPIVHLSPTFCCWKFLKTQKTHTIKGNHAILCFFFEMCCAFPPHTHKGGKIMVELLTLIYFLSLYSTLKVS